MDKGEIIRLCLCTDVQFVHVECLEMSVNIRSIYHCRICDVSLPLRRRNKPLVKWCINRTALFNMLKGSCWPIFKILILILYKICVIIIISYLIAYLDISNIGKFIPIFMVILVLISLLLCPICHEVRIMIVWITSIREYCQRWCESNQEMKMDRTSIGYQLMKEEVDRINEETV